MRDIAVAFSAGILLGCFFSFTGWQPREAKPDPAFVGFGCGPAQGPLYAYAAADLPPSCMSVESLKSEWAK